MFQIRCNFSANYANIFTSIPLAPDPTSECYSGNGWNWVILGDSIRGIGGFVIRTAGISFTIQGIASFLLMNPFSEIATQTGISLAM